jgi:mutator protein MutT
MPCGDDRAWPAIGVGAAIIHEGRVLLIRRAKEPLKGRWSLPGGTVEAGEPLEQAVVREVREETALLVAPGRILTVFDRIDRDEDGALLFHYVIVDYLCARVSGQARAGSDAQELAFAAPEELNTYDLTAKTLEVIRDAFAEA